MECKLCEKHVWSDHQEFHICLTDGKGREFDDSCESFQESRRGHHGCPLHENFYDLSVIEKGVKDDRHTRRKK